MRKIVVILMVMLLAAFVCAGWLLRSASGQARLERWIQSRLPASVRIAGLSGRLPFSGQLQSVELRDDAGVWGTAQVVSWSLQRRPLLRKQIVLSYAGAKTLTVSRWPDYGSDSDTNKVSRRPDIRIHRAFAESVHLPLKAAGESVPFHAQGELQIDRKTWRASGAASAHWRGESVEVEGAAHSSATNLAFTLSRASSAGISVRGAGEWGPSREVHLVGSFTNTPILLKLIPIESAGRGGGTLDVRWDEEMTGTFRFEVDDVSTHGIALAHAEGRGTLKGNEVEVRVATAGGEWRDEAWRALTPLVLHYGGDGVRWGETRIEWAGFSLKSAGRISDADVDATFALLPIDLAESPLSNRFSAGTARATVSVEGARGNPVWRYAVVGSNIQMRLPGAFHLNPAQLFVSGDLSDGALRSEASLSGLTREPATANVMLPLRLPLDGSPVGFDEHGSVAGRFNFALDLAEAGTYADLRGAAIAGKATGDIEVGGVWSRPLVRGKMALRDARAEYPESGTVLENIRIVLEGDQDRLAIREAGAEDGEGGGISLDGSIQFDLAHGFPLRAQLNLARATLFRREGNRVRFDGRVAVAGPLSALSVTGRVDVVDAEIQLRSTRPSIPQLPIASTVEESVDSKQQASWLDTVSLDVAVRGKGIHVSGRGLDSDWRAAVQVNGKASAPRIHGPVSVERGHFLFLGRRFLLDRAVLTLDGGWPLNPALDLMATSRAGDMQAWLFAAGSVNDLVLRLESDPAYPPDEILSRLLFGRSTDRISVFQAVSLAHGLSLLRGRGRTVDVLDRGQSLLRVDQLELVQSDESEGISAISVGKYVGRNVYIEGEKSFGTAADVITVEVELTPSLILSTESSPRIREGIGLKWRHDY